MPRPRAHAAQRVESAAADRCVGGEDPDEPGRIRSRLLQREPLHNQFLFINCSYDKALTTYEDEHGAGQIAITDRQKITRLLSILNAAPQKPKLIVLDLLLQDAPSNYDSTMFKEMGQTRNLIVGWDETKGDFDLPPSVRRAEAYYYSASGSFLKYPVLNKTGEYLPASIYTSLHSETNPHLTKSGFVRTQDSFWLNSFIVDIELREHALNYFNLGEFIDGFTPEEIQKIAYDKIVIMGEYFLDDQHDTVLGRQPAPLLVANTYLSLKKGQASITWTASIVLLIFYFTMSWRIVSMSIDRPVATDKPNRSKFTRFLLKYMTYLVIFSGFSIIMY